MPKGKIEEITKKDIEEIAKNSLRFLKEAKKIFEGLSGETLEALDGDMNFLDTLKEDLNEICEIEYLLSELNDKIEKREDKIMFGYIEEIRDTLSEFEDPNTVDIGSVLEGIDMYIELMEPYAKLTK